ncbi:hypothetical protein PQX77_018202 [Marasmius sp. AFHP31]|nr:hypothetical protein PQX77_018202 [Marasmius sp. AFHP31]
MSRNCRETIPSLHSAFPSSSATSVVSVVPSWLQYISNVSKAKGLWENLTGEDKDIPPLEDTVTTETVGTGAQASNRTITTPPSESEIAEWNA